MGQIFSSFVENCICGSSNQEDTMLEVKIERIVDKVEKNRQAHRENLDRIIRLEDRIDNKMTILEDKINRIDDKLDCKLDLIITAVNRPTYSNS